MPRIVVRRLADGEEHVIAFAEEAYSLGIDGGYEFATNLLRFTYSSMTTPSEVWDYDLAARTRTSAQAPGNPQRPRQPPIMSRGGCSRRLRTARPFRSRSFTARILRSDGTTPCLLYGYGAYGFSIPAAFDTNRLSLVDRGFVYAIAHVRGGSEKGRRWYREGKLAKKTNTFSDFIAASEYLIKTWLGARRARSSRMADPPAAH